MNNAFPDPGLLQSIMDYMKTSIIWSAVYAASFMELKIESGLNPEIESYNSLNFFISFLW